MLNDIGDENELLQVEEEAETCIAESLAKEILDAPDEPQTKRAMLRNLQEPRDLPRFPIKTWEKSAAGNRMPDAQSTMIMSMATTSKKAPWTTRKQSHNACAACHTGVHCIFANLAWVHAHGKHVPVTQSHTRRSTRSVPLFIQPLPLSRCGLGSAVLHSCRNRRRSTFWLLQPKASRVEGDSRETKETQKISTTSRRSKGRHPGHTASSIRDIPKCSTRPIPVSLSVVIQAAAHER